MFNLKFLNNRFNLFNEIVCFRAVEKGMQDSSGKGFFVLQLLDELIYILYLVPNYQLTPNE